jgi:acyl-CoA dehydrogenase
MSAATALPYADEHAIFRRSARRFFESECVPHLLEWEAAGQVPRSIWLRAGELGLLCPTISAAYGGGGADTLYSIVLMEEQIRAGVIAPMLSLHNDVVAPYIARYGTNEQKRRLLPEMAQGRMIGAIGMTTVWGVQAIKCRARRDGRYLIHGRRPSAMDTSPISSCSQRRPETAQTRADQPVPVRDRKRGGLRCGRQSAKLGQHARTPLSS